MGCRSAVARWESVKEGKVSRNNRKNEPIIPTTEVVRSREPLFGVRQWRRARSASEPYLTLTPYLAYTSQSEPIH